MQSTFSSTGCFISLLASHKLCSLKVLPPKSDIDNEDKSLLSSEGPENATCFLTTSSATLSFIVAGMDLGEFAIFLSHKVRGSLTVREITAEEEMFSSFSRAAAFLF